MYTIVVVFVVVTMKNWVCREMSHFSFTLFFGGNFNPKNAGP